MLPIDYRAKPSYKNDREGWNRTREENLTQRFGSEECPIRGGVLLPQLPLNDAVAFQVAQQKKDLCLLQRDLSLKASKRYVEDDFVAAWTRSSTEKERGVWILEALVRTCEAPDFEFFGQWAPETMLAVLQDNSGRGFLTLLESLIITDGPLSRDTIPTNFRTVSNPTFHDMVGGTATSSSKDDALIIHRLAYLLMRTLFLTLFCWNLLLAFHGETQEYGANVTESRKETKRSMAEIGATTHSKAVLKSDKGARSHAAGAHRCCTYCGLTAQLAVVKTLLQCSKCGQKNRTVFYCSKECQRKDWKQGNPPHKSICGQDQDSLIQSLINSMSDIPLSTSSDRWGIPEPDRTRSPALLSQLMLLDRCPGVLYVLVPPAPHCARALKSNNKKDADFFSGFFQRAICEYNPEITAILIYEFLRPAALATPGYGEFGLWGQLGSEFNVDIQKMKEYLPKGLDMYPDAAGLKRLAAELVEDPKFPNIGSARQDYAVFARNGGQRWRAPEPGFTRSPALLHQLRILEKSYDEGSDYVLMLPRPHDDRGVRCFRSALFRERLQIVLSKDSPKDVLILYALLKNIAEATLHYGLDGLKKQLFKEYGVDVDVERRKLDL